MMKKKNNSGFTMVELLIVTAMVAVISLATYSLFNSGIKLWQRTRTQALEEDLAIFFQKFESDVRNTFYFSAIPFIGEENRISLPSYLKGSQGIGQIVYTYVAPQKAIGRTYMDYSSIYAAAQKKAAPLVSNVTSLRFSFYAFDDELKEYVWLNQWFKQDMPLAVRASLELDTNNETKKFTRTVSIPVSG